MKDINTLTVADLTENAPPFTGWRWATEEAISAWGQAMKHGDRSVLDLAKKVKRQLDMMVAAPAPRIADQSPHDRQAAYDYLNEKGVSHILVSHLVEFANLQKAKNSIVPEESGEASDKVQQVAGELYRISCDLRYKDNRRAMFEAVLSREYGDPLTDIFDMQDAGFARCFEALGITDDRERGWSSLVLAINGALESRKQDFEFEGWFDREYPQNSEGGRPRYEETSVTELMRAAFEAGRDIGPKIDPIAWVDAYALRCLKGNATAVCVPQGMREENQNIPLFAQSLAITNNQRTALEAAIRVLSNGNYNSTLADYLRPLLETQTGDLLEEKFNLREQELCHVIDRSAVETLAGNRPPEGDAEHWKKLYFAEMACRITWQQKALEYSTPVTKAFEAWWEKNREEMIQDTDPRRHAESTWNASAANWARTEYVPVATLHDDGYFTWHGEKPPGFNYAGWRMKVYVDPAELEK